jgi:hypothetical protein
MHDTLDNLRALNPDKWLLIELDGPDAEEGTLLAAHRDARAIDAELESRALDRRKPLYMTLASPEDDNYPIIG